MASRAVGSDNDLKGVLIAISGNGHDVLIVSAGLSLEPKLLSRATPEAGQALLHRNLEALSVHIRYSQHAAGLGVNNYRGNQTVFVKFQFINIYHSNTPLYTNGNGIFLKLGFEIANADLAEMEDRRGKSRIHLGKRLEKRGKMVDTTRAARSDHGN